MKILFIHLSDLHINMQEENQADRFEKILEITKRDTGDSDAIFIVISGDLADNGKPEEYSEVSRYITYVPENYTKDLTKKC